MADIHVKQAQQAAERRPELKEALQRREHLVGRHSVLFKQMSVHPKGSPKHEAAARELAEVNEELTKIRQSFKERGQQLNNFIRAIVGEYLPVEVMKQVMEEANARYDGQSPRKLDLKLYKDEEQDILSEKYPKALQEIRVYKKKIRDLQDFIRQSTPDLSGYMTPEEYTRRTELIKFCSKLQALLR